MYNRLGSFRDASQSCARLQAVVRCCCAHALLTLNSTLLQAILRLSRPRGCEQGRIRASFIFLNRFALGASGPPDFGLFYWGSKVGVVRAIPKGKPNPKGEVTFFAPLWASGLQCSLWSGHYFEAVPVYSRLFSCGRSLLPPLSQRSRTIDDDDRRRRRRSTMTIDDGDRRRRSTTTIDDDDDRR